VETFLPAKVTSTFEIVSPLFKLLKGDISDFVPIILLVMFVWFASTKLFSWTIQTIIQLACKLVYTLGYLLLKLILSPFWILRTCFMKPKICKSCRNSISYDDQKVHTRCCKEYFHEYCFIERLSKNQLTCPGCNLSLHPSHFDLNLKAGLFVLKVKKEQQQERI
jgi:hypothetical protein